MKPSVLPPVFRTFMLKTAISEKTRTYSNLNVASSTGKSVLLVLAAFRARRRPPPQVSFLIIPVLRTRGPQRPESQFPGNCVAGTLVGVIWACLPKGHFSRGFDGLAGLPTHGRRNCLISAGNVQFCPLCMPSCHEKRTRDEGCRGLPTSAPNPRPPRGGEGFGARCGARLEKADSGRGEEIRSQDRISGTF